MASAYKILLRIFVLFYFNSILFHISCSAAAKLVIDDNNNFQDRNELTGLVDLSHGFKNDLFYREFKTPFSVASNSGSNNHNNFLLPSYASGIGVSSALDQGSTRLDSPYHFNDESWKIDDIPLDHLFVTGLWLDVSNETEQDSEFLLKPKHLMDWEKRHGEMPKNSVLLIHFGWASRWPDKNSYLGLKDNEDGDTACHFPGISEDAANWIVKKRNIVGVGVDTASVDVGTSTDFKVHKIFSSANIYNVENINFQTGRKLPPRGFDLVVIPMKIIDGDVAPCRIIAKPTDQVVEVKNQRCNTKRRTRNDRASEEESELHNSTTKSCQDYNCCNKMMLLFTLLMLLIK